MEPTKEVLGFTFLLRFTHNLQINSQLEIVFFFKILFLYFANSFVTYLCSMSKDKIKNQEEGISKQKLSLLTDLPHCVLSFSKVEQFIKRL